MFNQGGGSISEDWVGGLGAEKLNLTVYLVK